ncbi:hypothetical protein ACFVYG_09245 [Streptomyces sp. NPDC058256]|uniref:hypothetical protein n=1 Tax=Streptomyces sp. NPDC058256 TaxID=3346408 RepID=UPI0036E869A3
MVELIPSGEVRPPERGRTLSDRLTLTILAASSVITVALIAVKGILDQLPDVLNSWRRAAQAMREGSPRDESEEEPPRIGD